jgi:hypothetical protein
VTINCVQIRFINEQCLRLDDLTRGPFGFFQLIRDTYRAYPKYKVLSRFMQTYADLCSFTRGRTNRGCVHLTRDALENEPSTSVIDFTTPKRFIFGLCSVVAESVRPE